MYAALFALLGSPVAELASTSDRHGRRRRQPSEPRFSRSAISNLERVLTDSPLRSHFSPQLRETLRAGELRDALVDSAAYNCALTLAWFGLWLERYGSLLRDPEPAEALELAA
jgi:hypothetical protein